MPCSPVLNTMPGLTPLKAAAGVKPTLGGGAETEGGPGRAMALASVAPKATALGSCKGSQPFSVKQVFRQFRCKSKLVGCKYLIRSDP